MQLLLIERFWIFATYELRFCFQTGTQYLLNVIRASYRLLLARPEVFATLWDWSCFLDLVPQSADLDPGGDAELYKNVSDMKWCGIQILSVVLKTSDRATCNTGLVPEEAFACLLRLASTCFLAKMLFHSLKLCCVQEYVEDLLREVIYLFLSINEGLHKSLIQSTSQ